MDVFPSHGSLQDSSQDAPRILGTLTSVSEDVPHLGSLDIDKISQGPNTSQKVKVQDLPTSSRFENGCCKLRSRVTILSEKLTEHE